jgi:hypothetical protein
MERLVGIRVEAGPEPVFHLRPGVHLPIDSLKARWQSRWGELRVGWQTVGDRRELHVTIPPGCKGQIHEPGKSPAAPWGSGEHQITISRK